MISQSAPPAQEPRERLGAQRLGPRRRVEAEPLQSREHGGGRPSGRGHDHVAELLAATRKAGGDESAERAELLGGDERIRPGRQPYQRALDPGSGMKRAGLHDEQLLHATRDRKSTRLNSSHGYISYAVFCLKKKK